MGSVKFNQGTSDPSQINRRNLQNPTDKDNKISEKQSRFIGDHPQMRNLTRRGAIAYRFEGAPDAKSSKSKI